MDTVQSQMERLSDVDLFTDNKNKRLLEKWCAARFGMGYSQNIEGCKIEIEDLDERREYDFQLITANQRLPFQLAEALDEKRHRGWEYKNLPKEKIEARHRAKVHIDSQQGAQRLREVLTAKVKKNYAEPEKLHILLYANINVSQLKVIDLEAELVTAARHFASVWVVTEYMLICIYGGTNWHGFRGWRQIKDDG